jgi:hypothetical protein
LWCISRPMLWWSWWTPRSLSEMIIQIYQTEYGNMCTYLRVVKFHFLQHFLFVGKVLCSPVSTFDQEPNSGFFPLYCSSFLHFLTVWSYRPIILQNTTGMTCHGMMCIGIISVGYIITLSYLALPDSVISHSLCLRG